MSCLQLSVDRAIEDSWFASRLVSEYDVTHTLDIQDLGLPSRAFDIVICNHVLEHVEQDRQAMAELFRVVSDRGLLQVAFPDPARNATTRDWGYPDWDDHGHYRIYGMDACEKLREACGGAYFVQFPTADPTTGMDDIYFFMTRSDTVVDTLKAINDRTIVEGGDRRNLSPARAADLVQERLVRDPKGFHHDGVMGGETSLQSGPSLDQLQMSEVQRRIGIGGHVCFLGAPDPQDFLALCQARRLGERALTTYDPETDLAPDPLRDITKNILSPDPDIVELSCNFGKLNPRDVRAKIMGSARLVLCSPITEGVVERHRLNLAEAITAPGGLVIVNKFLNAAQPGSTSATMAHFARTPLGKLRPVALSEERLYLTDEASAPRYREELQKLADIGAIQTSQTRLFGADVMVFSANPEAFAARTVTKSGGISSVDATEGVNGAHGRVYPLRLEGVEPKETVTLTLGLSNISDPIEISATGAAEATQVETGGSEAKLAIDLKSLGVSRRVEVRIAPQRSGAIIGDTKLVAVSLT